MAVPNDSTKPPASKPAEGDSVPTIIGQVPRNPVTEALALAAGSTLGHFEIIAPLGAGGMASVLKARDTHLGRLVALKILPPDAAHDPDSVARFRQEARAAAKLDHDNVARVFFSGEDRGLHFIAFEFVEGETLRARIERLGRLSCPESVRFLLHCAAGLRHLHERGVIHRDIKPSNVVVTEDGRAKLIDLGLARHAESVSVNGGVTQSGVTLGTFDYISPEQARDPRTVDVRSDIYSLGCTFYHALTGRPPVPEGTAAVKLSAQQLSAPPDPRELNPDVPDSLAMVLNRMLAKEPGRRYATPDELTADLNEVARQLGVSVDRPAADSALVNSSTTHTRLMAEPARFPVRWVVVGVVLLAAGLVFVSLTNNRPPVPLAPPWDDPIPMRSPSPFDGLGKEELPKRVAPAGPRTVATTSELLDAIRGESVQIVLPPRKVFDLTDTPGLYFAGKRLSIESADPLRPATLRVALSPADDSPAERPGGFTVHQAESVTLRGVRFEFVERPGSEDETLEPVGLSIVDCGRVETLGCTWEEPDDKDRKARAASVTAFSISRTAKARPTEFTARHCYWGVRRWTGLELDGPVTASFTECGFASSRAAIRLAAPESVAVESTVELRHCTFLLDQRAAAVLAESGKVGVSAGFCVFAAPAAPDPMTMMMTDGDRKPVLLRAGADATAAFRANTGEPSAYYRCEIPAGADAADTVDLTVAPWKTVPPAPDRPDPWKALELNPAVRGVRVSKPAGVHILGATRLPAEKARLYADWPPGSTSANAPKEGVKVWYPNPLAAEKGQLPRDVFEDFQKAIDALRPRDELHIRATGVVKVPTAVLAKADRTVVIRPEEGSLPILVPAGDGPLFRVEKGELRLERLHLRLALPEDAAAKPLTAVALTGGKGCTWTDCTFTAEDRLGPTSAAVLVSAAPDLRPDLRFDRCVFRGTGRLARLPTVLPATITLTNSVVALSGPVFELGPPDTRLAPGATVRVRAQRVTALLNAPLVEWTLADMSLEAPALTVQLEVESSLFAPADKATAPVLRATNADPDWLGKLFTWTAPAEKPNRLANYPERAALIELPPKTWASLDWPAFAGERRKTALGKVTFAHLPTARELVTLTAADLTVVEADTNDEFGAKPGQLPLAPEPAEK